MAKEWNYCKAYPVEYFRKFSFWTENLENLRKEKKKIDGKDVEVRRTLRERDHFYLHDDFTVTDGIFMDKNIIFDDVTDEWITFCKETLKFEVPAYATVKTEIMKVLQKKMA